MSTTTAPPRKLNLLFLHGYTQSGPLFHAKTRALEKQLQKAFPASPSPGSLPSYPGGVSLTYPTAPIPLKPADIPGYNPDNGKDYSAAEADGEETDAWAWWRRSDNPGTQSVYRDLEKGLQRIAETLKSEGPFDGVVGFSQGGCAAGMVTSLLEENRVTAFRDLEKKGIGMAYPDCFLEQGGDGVERVIHPPLKFGVSYSGFAASVNDAYGAFYEPKIGTPMLHFLGSVDTVVEEGRSLKLVEACENARGGGEGKVDRVVYHPGGHFLPSQKQWVAALVNFIREVVGGGEGEGDGKKEEENVEDMDVPF